MESRASAAAVAAVSGIRRRMIHVPAPAGLASVVASSTRYTAIYSGFAVLILFLMWLYLSWLILLVGASIAFYVQHPRQLHPHRGERALSGRTRERLALLLMTRIGRDHFEGGTPPTLEQLAHLLDTADC